MKPVKTQCQMWGLEPLQGQETESETQAPLTAPVPTGPDHCWGVEEDPRNTLLSRFEHAPSSPVPKLLSTARESPNMLNVNPAWGPHYTQILVTPYLRGENRQAEEASYQRNKDESRIQNDCQVMGGPEEREAPWAETELGRDLVR